MQALKIVEYLEENGLYYQLYTDKGVYVPEYGVESVRREIEDLKIQNKCGYTRIRNNCSIIP